jgi:predicted metal-dependent hydrolase
MRFLVRLENKQYSPADKRRLTMVAYNAVKGLGADIGNLRVSKSAIELDLLLESEANLKGAVVLLEKNIGPVVTLRKLDVEGQQIGEREAVRLGLELFNGERYWESHEALEVAWRKASDPEKEILQGIILLAAALVHLQKDEPGIALSVMRRAQEKLERHAGNYDRVNLDTIKSQVNAMLAASQPNFFKIDLGA